MPSEYTEVDGVDYSPEAIEQVRKDLTEHRDRSMDAWPEGIAYSVLMSHVIALLHKLAWYETRDRVVPEKRTAPPTKPRPDKGLPSLPPQQGSR